MAKQDRRPRAGKAFLEHHPDAQDSLGLRKAQARLRAFGNAVGQLAHVERLAARLVADALNAETAPNAERRRVLAQVQAELSTEDQKWRTKFGEPYPVCVDDLKRMAARAGLGADTVHAGEWTADDVLPVIEGYLQRLADGRGQSVSAGRRAAAGLPETRWPDVQARLLRLCQAKERYTTQKDLADRLGCSPSTINKAINASLKLRAWKERYAKRTPRAQSLGPLVTDKIASRREPDPSEIITDDEVDVVMAQLISQAKTPSERSKLNGLDSDGRREMVRVYLDQCEDKALQDRAKRGPRLLGRKP